MKPMNVKTGDKILFESGLNRGKLDGDDLLIMKESDKGILEQRKIMSAWKYLGSMHVI